MKVSSNMLRRFVCGALVMTSMVFISGCELNVDHFKSVVNNKPQVTEKSEEEQSRVFHFYLAAMNEYNADTARHHELHEKTIAGFEEGLLADSFWLPDYERLELELIAANEAGETYESVRKATDELLPILHHMVDVSKQLKSYAKAQKEGQLSSVDFASVATEYIQLREIYLEQFHELDIAIDEMYKYELERDLKLLQAAGYVNYAKIKQMQLVYSQICGDIWYDKRSINQNDIYSAISRADSLASEIKSAEAQNFLDASSSLNDALRAYAENPSKETGYRIMDTYNAMIEAPLNPNLLDKTGNSGKIETGRFF